MYYSCHIQNCYLLIEVFFLWGTNKKDKFPSKKGEKSTELERIFKVFCENHKTS